MSITNILLTLLVYPGLFLLLSLGALFAWLFERRLPALAPSAAPLRSLHGVAALASLLLAALGLALLPWPYHPFSGWRAIGVPATLWVLFEGAFLLPLLPGFLAADPLAARAASREAQIGVAGRCVFWLAAGSALWTSVGISPLRAPGHLLLALGGLLALPAAIGLGPFGAERSLSAAGAESGLDAPTVALVRFARLARGAALLAALSVAVLPAFDGSGVPPALAGRADSRIMPWAGLAIIAGLFAVFALVLRQVSVLTPRMTLPGALRWCWRWALPLALAGAVYLAVVTQ